MKKMTAAQHVQAIRNNIDAWYSNAIDYATYTRNQSALWHSIESSKAMQTRVLDIINADKSWGC